MSRRIGGLGMVGVAMLLGSGCTSGGHIANGQVSGPPGFPPAAAPHPMGVAEHFSDGSDFDVPPAGARPAVSAELAYRSCDVDGTCDRGHPPDIEIASVTVPDVKDAAGAAIVGRLAFVFSWSGIPCVGAGPASTEAPTICTSYQLVDAATGRTLYGMSDSSLAAAAAPSR